jgi:hypothetical protein
MLGAISPLPQYVFMAWCFVKHRDNFTFDLLRCDYVFNGGFMCEISDFYLQSINMKADMYKTMIRMGLNRMWTAIATHLEFVFMKP